MLLNVNFTRGDAAKVMDFLRQSSPEILVLEEVNESLISQLSELHETHPHSIIEPREDDFGIALFSKLPLVRGEVVAIGSAGVPSIIATVQAGNQTLDLLATHPFPPAGALFSRRRNEQLALLPDWIDATKPFLLLGDLNVTPWSPYFHDLLAKTGLRDSSLGRGVQPSWPDFNPLLRIPIDHVLHSPSIAVHDRFIGPVVGSDHFPVIVDFHLPESGSQETPSTSAP